MLDEIIQHLRALRADCSKSMAWCSALVWAEKTLLLSGNVEDLLWLVDALVTNGQYRQAEEWMANPRYAAKCRASATGRYLASIVAMRLGRAEDALEFLAIDDSIYNMDIIAGGRQQGGRSGESSMLQTPTMKKATIGTAPPATLFSQGSSIADTEATGNSSNSSSSIRDSLLSINTVPLNRKALMLYMQGAAVVQLSNIGGNEMTPSISRLGTKYGTELYGLLVETPTTGGKSRLDESDKRSAARLGHMGMLVTRLWTDALRADPRCWEAWSGIREHGFLTCQEEIRLIESLDWTACCGGSVAVGRFFKNYCLATQTAYSLSDATIEATGNLISLCPSLIEDPTLRTIQASRLLSIGRARESLEYTVRVLEYRRVPDPIATAIHITALTVLHSKKALFRIAHELAEEFGISSIKRAEIEPADTHTSVSLSSTGSAGEGSTSGIARSSSSDGFGSSGVYGATSTPRGTTMGASVSGASRIRTGARGLLIPDTPSRTGGVNASSIRRTSTAGAASALIARSVVQSASAAATAAWRGLWGLPTWTHPGPPVLATYPCALGPAQGAALSSETSMSTINYLTTTNAQSVGSPTQYEFIGASLAWYAIGCYYLVSAALMVCPEMSQREWPLTGLSVSVSAATSSGLDDRGATSVGLRRMQALTPETEHTLAEARRWLAKTTLTSPRSIIAWVAFAHTFVIAGEWEAATRALHTAVGLCGCDDIIHGGGRDNADLPPLSHQTPSKQRAQKSSAGARNSLSGDLERGSQLAHLPLASLGSVYLQMGDLGMAESCFDASARCLSGYRISQWLSAWKPLLEPLPNSGILVWTASIQVDKSGLDAVKTASLADPQLLNDIGVMFHNRNDMQSARIFFILALTALRLGSVLQHRLHSVLSPTARTGTRSGQRLEHRESQAYNALFKANLGSTLRHIGDYSAAQTCLGEALVHAPSNSEILLSAAFTLHLSAIDKCSNPPFSASAASLGLSSELDQAIDMYHRVLSEHPGDPVTTDLLTLALELSVGLQSVPSLGMALGDIGRRADEADQEIVIREPEELGIPEFGSRGRSGGGLLDLIPRSNNSRHDAQKTPDSYGGINSSQELPASPIRYENQQASEDEDSDEVMDIEEDTDSASESDMAMD
ncbi:anaphase-promoting complex subunit Cut9 [Coemansia sp. RSA 485]|nr:anaphase-promoting complex subunit Cut9 [Coemansia sp. RSA 485]